MQHNLQENEGDVSDECWDISCVNRLRTTVDTVHKSIAELHQSTLAFSDTVNRSYECLDQLLTLLAQCGVETDKLLELDGAKSAKEVNFRSLREIAHSTLAVCHKLRDFADVHVENALEKVAEYVITDTPERAPLPVTIRKRKMTTNELIYTLGEAPMVSFADYGREACLRKTVTQAHYELASAKAAYKQLLDCTELPRSGDNVIEMAANRIERTLRILSTSIRELIAMDKAYEDFFYAYLNAMENKDTQQTSNGKPIRGINSHAIDSILSSQQSKENEDHMKTYEKRLHDCAATMGSLMQEFIQSFSPIIPTEADAQSLL
ncbi:GHKL domain-containing protein, putative [Babesia ovata]|uniref:GHKL domain-containing protein, putative n=1 Tax=Babesia ovata TaxID=189622 RepID=A0A2H6KA69_9APIC|nr:GHKL domain-containing protein, putative [Babesia ovata]GBE59886.1 GHKL domain-containing protein, putative [Babesia ovata]